MRHVIHPYHPADAVLHINPIAGRLQRYPPSLPPSPRWCPSMHTPPPPPLPPFRPSAQGAGGSYDYLPLRAVRKKKGELRNKAADGDGCLAPIRPAIVQLASRPGPQGRETQMPAGES
ncbi:hypothetical protein LZ32DRAFT_295580 [Colletotrichum eremochloae]|nr:hypothetical protein LZ32DRAFT_295580 [Colletotrichum eremochloae]